MLASRKVFICAKTSEKVHLFSSVLNWRNEYHTIIYCSFFTFFWGHSKTYSASLLPRPEKWILSCQDKYKQRIATNFHVTFRFLNFSMTFSPNFFALESIVTAIILELIYLWRNFIWKWIRGKEATLHTFDRFKRIFHEGGTVRDKQGVFHSLLGLLESP